MMGMVKYDFIIVGGGSAGCVVASRLTEDPNVSVLLLEAGPSDKQYPDIYDPAKFASLKRTPIDWNFKTERQTRAYKGYTGDGIATWPRGKVLGGSSCLNHMLYVRGDAADYDSWEKLGATGWSWKDVYPYFLKLENYQGHVYKNSPYQNVGGPINVTDASTENGNITEASAAFIKAGVELGYDEINTNRGNSLGFGVISKSIDSSGHRSSTAKAYIRPAENRPNLTVMTEAHVLRINFTHLQAVGVSYLQNGKEKIVAARKDIIISAGSIGSPQILMLSGIGPRSHLEDLGIHCIADLQVGCNLQDHPFVQLKASVDEAADVLTATMKTKRDAAVGYIRFGSEPKDNWSDTQLLFIPELYSAGPDEQTMLYELKSSRLFPYMGYDLPREERMRKKGLCIHVMIGHPRSRGFVKLLTADPLVPPIIQPHYFEEPYDMKIFCESIRFVDKLLKTKAMSHLRPKMFNMKMPDNPHDELSDENLADFVRHFAWTSYHPVGTCKMGASDDNTAVVDPQLRVRGIKGLRVIDASIMPHLTTGNTNVPSIMIGEKGADLIKQGMFTHSKL